jgi:hypothetical protein
LRHSVLQRPAGNDKLGCAFGNPQYRGIRGRRYHRGHHRRIGNPQAVNSAHTQCWVHHRKVIGTDSARADQVEEGIRGTSQERAAILIALHFGAGTEFSTAPRCQRSAMGDFARQP